MEHGQDVCWAWQHPPQKAADDWKEVKEHQCLEMAAVYLNHFTLIRDGCDTL